MTRFLDSRYEQWPAWPLYLQKPGHENHTSSMPAVTQYGCACICLLRRYAGRGDHSISYTSAKWSRIDTCSDEALVRFSEVKRLWIEFIWVHATCLASLPVFHAYVWLNVCVFDVFFLCGFTEDFTPVSFRASLPPKPAREVPPYNGFGSEEDSLCSCQGLLLKPPQKDFKKLMEKDR